MLKMRATRAWRLWAPAVTVAVTATAAGVVSAAPASAQTIVNCPAQNLQTAIDNAAPGSTIMVAGTCAGNVTVEKNLSLIGFGGAVLDGNAAGTTLTVGAGADVQVSALTIANGSAENGAGLLNNGSVTLNYSIVRDSNANFYGGAVLNAGMMTLNGSTVHSSTADVGGGIANFSGATLTLNASTVRDNTALSGGGVANLGGTVTMNYSAVTTNTSVGGADAGGGIHNSSGSVSLMATSVTDNSPNACTGSVEGCTG
ncbi:hypothetical protein FBY35_3312 [Streptomyces sp. SLBN-118]|uniref:hypothetical protein n=1 Tax=Streptomyces sp. SLBN-118 TaxID=2768454 RepID=UPI00115025D5|nr:hypothetical protein [Streptomyces sp. SLBN-118]TQK52856.1 hypothetical protein FBY35_3312 [Streptomyces sp. SLBN-118]